MTRQYEVGEKVQIKTQDGWIDEVVDYPESDPASGGIHTEKRYTDNLGDLTSFWEAHEVRPRGKVVTLELSLQEAEWLMCVTGRSGVVSVEEYIKGSTAEIVKELFKTLPHCANKLYRTLYWKLETIKGGDPYKVAEVEKPLYIDGNEVTITDEFIKVGCLTLDKVGIQTIKDYQELAVATSRKRTFVIGNKEFIAWDTGNISHSGYSVNNNKLEEILERWEEKKAKRRVDSFEQA